MQNADDHMEQPDKTDQPDSISDDEGDDKPRDTQSIDSATAREISDNDDSPG